ncbi:MAG: AAA family ATPase [Candidatus Thiodiazotropha sp.]
MPMEHAAYAKPDYRQQKKNLTPSTAPRHDDLLSRHRLSYLSGGGGSGKTTRAIELFRQKEPLVFTPTHLLAKEMRARGAKAQTYHSFFRWSGQTEWTPERMGQKYILRVIIWDEVCTVPRPILETFLDWLDDRSPGRLLW